MGGSYSSDFKASGPAARKADRRAIYDGGGPSVPPGPEFVGILDQLDTAGLLGAWSVARRLTANFQGSPIRVRSSAAGNPTTDIPFADNISSESQLVAHVGGNDGFITKAYTQAGSGIGDLIQSAPSNQPRVVSGGLIEKANHRLAVRMTATSHCNLGSLNITTINTNTLAVVVVASLKTTTPTFGRVVSGFKSGSPDWSNVDGFCLQQSTVSSSVDQVRAGAVATKSIVYDQLTVFSMTFDSSVGALAVNGDTAATGASTGLFTIQNFMLGAGTVNMPPPQNPLDGMVVEAFIFRSIPTGLTSLISDCKQFYNII